MIIRSLNSSLIFNRFRENLLPAISENLKLISTIAGAALLLLTSIFAYRLYQAWHKKNVKKSDEFITLKPMVAKYIPPDDTGNSSVKRKTSVNERKAAPTYHQDPRVTLLEESDEEEKKQVVTPTLSPRQEVVKNEVQEELGAGKSAEPKDEHLPSLDLYKLLTLGEARKGAGKGAYPSVEEIQYFGNPHGAVKETEQMYTAIFACCFHTSESHEEIHDLLLGIRKKMDHPFFSEGHAPVYAESFARLYNNLVKLYDKLPGGMHAREVKIYWSKSVEEILIPYLFKHDLTDSEVNELFFSIIEGEAVDSPFQAPIMDFKKQLQFIDLNEDGIYADLCVYGANLMNRVVIWDEDFMDLLDQRYLHAANVSDLDLIKRSSIFKNAFEDSMFIRIIANLQILHQQGRTINMNKMTSEEQTDFCDSLFIIAPPFLRQNN